MNSSLSPEIDMSKRIPEDFRQDHSLPIGSYIVTWCISVFAMAARSAKLNKGDCKGDFPLRLLSVLKCIYLFIFRC